MAKSIIKEIGIVILLLVAIALVMAIIFYEYNPTSKTIPLEIQAYTLPEDIQKELKDSTKEETIVKTCYIDSTDLDVYESTNEYDKGKANPFANYDTQDANNSSSTTGDSKDNSNNSSTTTDNNSNNSNSTTTNNNSNSNNSTAGSSNNSESNNSTENKEVYMTTPGKNY